jgi:DNA-binding SARP family transcriptional activator
MRMAPLHVHLQRADHPPRLPGDCGLRPGQTDLDVRVLGAFEVVVDGVDRTDHLVGRSRSILQYLVLSGGAVPRDVLLGTFWPDFDVDRARNNLNVAISGIRRALGEQGRRIVQHRAGSYRFGPDVVLRLDVDVLLGHLGQGHACCATGDTAGAVTAFEAASEAYGGDLLPEDPYSDWLAPRRAFVRHAYLDGLHRLAELHRSDGRLFEASRACQLGLMVDDLDEEMMERWFHCLAERGAGRQLVTAWAEFRERLARTLDDSTAGRLVDLAPAAANRG